MTKSRWFLGSMAAVTGGAVALAVVLMTGGSPATSGTATGLSRVSGIPDNVPTGLADLMSLSAVPAVPAPGFTLTDQNGSPLSLAGFRGKAVVLEFMDPHCTDICPVISQEFITAYHDLGSRASQVVFLAVNVNPYHAAVADMQAFSAEQRLTSVPSWHFVTGQVPTLRQVWRGYNIAVQAPNPDADVTHSSTAYFIGPDGRERYIAVPMDDRTSAGAGYLPASQIQAWGHGIAVVAGDLIR